MAIVPDQIRGRITQLTSKELDQARLGETLYKNFGQEIDSGIKEAGKERLKLARSHHRAAKNFLTSPRPHYRTIISRAYYAMYHAFRSVSFTYNKGDDYQAHSTLPKNIPKDFPQREIWENTLKTARLQGAYPLSIRSPLGARTLPAARLRRFH
jgi:uncharacterized protein (UPF0332 family)